MDTIVTIGPALLGAALGYIMMTAFVNPDSYEAYSYRLKLEPTWKGIVMFIAVAASMTVLAGIPDSSVPVGYYALGVGLGVFARELVRFLAGFFEDRF
jgi:hypothetical protein